ncbi:MAG: hypothetical protein QME55_14895 [Brevundimonas sp.]|uniref:hypothetical protein n=1 Tax=Brevundimonas sp. TaxID=1871086 RepID=UPI002636589D|nr:hypothetical protein [Brevundimonas sp.]MDI6626015.1 hypothetical protein [Brevundimonas sp.]MDQ7813813.1 hypothetical protein [Brevundimonas sp.]
MSVVLAAVSPSIGQEASEDWNLITDPAQRVTLATLDFGDTGLALRCKADVLEFLLIGTPTTSATFRDVRVTAGGIADEGQAWSSPPGFAVLSASEPGRLARQLRAGGDLIVQLEPASPNEPALRYQMATPPSAAALDRVLSACEEPLADDWDLLPRLGTDGGVTWARGPRPEFPGAALHANARHGSVQLGCIVPADGRLRECRILSETPPDLGFGEKALSSALRSRIALPENDTSAVGKVLKFTIRFAIS